jgi:hypothetical protein
LYSRFKSERLKANIKLILLKALIRSAMTYACPASEFAAESHLFKSLRLQNRVLRTIGNFPRRTSVRDLHVAFQISYVYDYITKLCRQQAEVIQNHDNENIRNIGAHTPISTSMATRTPKKKQPSVAEAYQQVKAGSVLPRKESVSPTRRRTTPAAEDRHSEPSPPPAAMETFRQEIRAMFSTLADELRQQVVSRADTDPINPEDARFQGHRPLPPNPELAAGDWESLGEELPTRPPPPDDGLAKLFKL